MAVKFEAEKDARIPCYFGFTTQKQWRHYIKDLLRKNDNAVIRAVIQIYNRQTFDEQIEQESNVENGIGFSKNDAPFLSTVAIAFISGKQVDKKTFEITRNKMMHYWKQLMNISKEGLEEKFERMKQRLLNEEKGEEDAGDNIHDKCIDNSNSGSDTGEDTQMYLFPELFGEVEKNPSSNNPSDCRCDGHGLEYLG